MTTLRDSWRRFNYWLDQYLTPAVKWLVLANLVVFLFAYFLVQPLGLGEWFLTTFAQNPVVQIEPGPAGGEQWDVNWLCTLQFFTYMFVHMQFWHLFLNMLGLWFFGPALEYHWGTPAFTKFYIFTGFLAGLTHGLLAPFVSTIAPSYWMFGASGAIFGVLLAFGLSFPHQQVLLFFLIPVPAILVVVIFGLFTLTALVGGPATGISHLTHLAGFGFGYLWLWLHGRMPNFWLFNNDPGPFRRHGGGHFFRF